MREPQRSYWVPAVDLKTGDLLVTLYNETEDPATNFLDDSADVWEITAVAKTREPRRPYDFQQFRICPLLNFRVGIHRQEERFDGRERL
jgi:hypothetical protein